MNMIRKQKNKMRDAAKCINMLRTFAKLNFIWIKFSLNYNRKTFLKR